MEGSLTPDGTHGSVASPEITRTGLTGIGALFTDFAICKSDPYITTQPSNTPSLCPGSNTQFTVAANGFPTLTYRWQENTGSGFADVSDGVVFSGTTTTTLSITGVTLGMNGYLYRCEVTDGDGNIVNSNSASLTVEDNESPVPTCAVSGQPGGKHEQRLHLMYTRMTAGTERRSITAQRQEL